MVTIVSAQLNMTRLPAHQRAALRSGTTCSIRNGQEGEDGTKHYRRVACALNSAASMTSERITGLVLVVADCGHDQIGAVNGDHTRLGQSGAWVVFLDLGMDAKEGNEGAEGEIERDEELVQGTS